jgi:two-component system, OmpR family, phosphate regulon sensor histidine kinase PhoR
MHKSKLKLGELEAAVEEMSESLADNFKTLSAERGRIFAVLSSMAEAVVAIDADEKIILVNPAYEKIFGAFEPEILARPVREGIKNNEISDIMERTLHTGERVEEEISIVFPVQGSFVALANPIKDDKGEIIGVVCVLHDITNLKKLEVYRSEFVANVSHELKTPLTAIRNYAETLINGAINDRDHNLEFLAKIDKHASNLSALIDDILEISNLEAKKELGPYVRIDLEKIISKAIETVSGKAQKKNISLEKQCGGEFYIHGIEDHIYRAVLNLLDNAVNYTGEGGRVEISCERTGDKLEISVSDNGIGIPRDHLHRIFERFYRVDKARSRDLGGTGLGLAIVKHVANIHNGSVSVESDEGKGSKFTIILPAA